MIIQLLFEPEALSTMGRKIPGKKHRGVKDPAKQQARRFEELKTKINAPPKDVNEQAIPKSLARVIKLKEDVKSGKIRKVKKKRKKNKTGLIEVGKQVSKVIHPKARPDKVVPIFSQRPGEDGRAFLSRVSKETQAFLQETKFEKKYGVEVKRNLETGKIEGLTETPKNELDELAKLQMKHKNTKKKKKVSENEVKLTKAQKRKQKLEAKKEKKLQDNIDEFKIFEDKVEFGDIVHAPPELRIRPGKMEQINSAKSGKKDLLLNSLFKKDTVSSSKSNTVDRTGKRKDLPAAERRILDKQQSEVIAAYRKLKAQKSLGS
ncbi:coiled-coil domain-containing protein 137 isoform X2 [Cephus cinctus]|uniref:Coiled-coil domain-containing protein 137 isoform X2 n=1 Tax=Cephus cinctus TaxID=211228 RepID=A0AAJ7BNU7_CEPCN|nr:coiled-coil domain-containing protein 137 isoform X2 [Cephus cinctus]XP_024938680.1 coiled-coil domain-containing protein 137 isoform X2 [Cephus cinctus]